MAKSEISINQIALRSRSIPPQVVRTAVEGLGPEILRNLTEQGFVQPGQTIRLDALNLGTLSVQSRGDAQELRQEIVRVLTQAINTQFRRK